MQEAVVLVKEQGIEAAKEFINDFVSKVIIMKLDYFEVCDADTLKPISDFNHNQKTVCLIALFVGNIRLIDNWMVE